MRNIYSMIFIFLLAMFIFPLQAEEVNVTGVWEMTLELPSQDITRTYKFIQDGEKLQVIGIRKGVEGEPIQGTVKGNKIEWIETGGKANDEDVEVTYTGTIEGDTITGEMEFELSGGMSGSYDWTAKRKEK